MTSTSPGDRAADWRRSQARTRLLIAVRRAERRADARSSLQELVTRPPAPATGRELGDRFEDAQNRYDGYGV